MAAPDRALPRHGGPLELAVTRATVRSSRLRDFFAGRSGDREFRGPRFGGLSHTTPGNAVPNPHAAARIEPPKNSRSPDLPARFPRFEVTSPKRQANRVAVGATCFGL